MNFRSSILAAAIFAAGTTYAVADTVVISPEQETVIREYVVKHPTTTTVTLPEGYVLEEGAELPGDINLGPVDAPDINYDYTVIDGRTVLVDRGARRVVHILN